MHDLASLKIQKIYIFLFLHILLDLIISLLKL
jgi:hypothetical protein